VNFFNLSVPAVLVVSIVATSGCHRGGIKSQDVDRVSVRSTVVAMHQAVSNKDYDAILACFAPDYRGSFRGILSASKDYSAKVIETAALIEQRVDAAPAQKLRKEVEETYRGLLPSPLEGATVDGKIQWERVQIDEQRDYATVEVDHHITPFGKKFELVRLSGSWYVTPDESAKKFSADAKRMTHAYRQFIKVLDRLQGKIKRGKVTKENIDQELWPASGE